MSMSNEYLQDLLRELEQERELKVGSLPESQPEFPKDFDPFLTVVPAYLAQVPFEAAPQRTEVANADIEIPINEEAEKQGIYLITKDQLEQGVIIGRQPYTGGPRCNYWHDMSAPGLSREQAYMWMENGRVYIADIGGSKTAITLNQSGLFKATGEVVKEPSALRKQAVEVSLGDIITLKSLGYLRKELEVIFGVPFEVTALDERGMTITFKPKFTV